ncbi:DUF4383 domain-containing protein [Qaidamihabitans albus]|uniref:DUF4383 domain-containing protein n=1 Tax=Qaidamihabitans albus TaxID=2795733 RepID=UPI0018F1594F|nr:DUF4383 domain-containing protein [Qaidamihabitans albus]
MTRPAETRVRVGGLQPTQVLAGLVGLAYLAIGIIGFTITGFGDFAAAEHSTLWVFAINPLHNVVHLVIGVLGVLMAVMSGLARTFGWLLFVAFGVLFVWGLAITDVFATNPVSGLGNPLAIDTADNWLHLGTALVGLLIAVLPARRVVERGETVPPGTVEERRPAEENEPTTETTETTEHGGHRRFGRHDPAR